MITQLPIEKILKTALSCGGDFAEIFYERSVFTNIVNDDHRLENIFSTTDAGIGIRVIYGSKVAYGSTNDTSSLLLLAKSVASAARNGKHGVPVIKNIKITEPRQEKPQLEMILSKKIDIVSSASKAAWGAGSQVCQVRVAYRDKIRQIEIITSDNLYSFDEQVETVFFVQAVASDGKVLQTGYEPVGGSVGFELFEKNPPEKVALLAAKRAISMLTAMPAASGPMSVILSSNAGGTMIHEAVGHGLEADLAGYGLSVYANRVGEKVASPLITVYDDATIFGRRGSFLFDDEGTSSGRTCLIEKGLLKGYMKDRIWAMKENSFSTGNGRRESYQYPPIVRMTNTIICPGSDDPSDIISATEKGLFITRMGGGQVNTVNGDFIFEVQEGYRIEHGRVGEPVRGATLIGNGPKVLEIIDKVGTDLGFSIGTCGKNGQNVPVESGHPTIRIPEIVVGGV